MICFSIFQLFIPGALGNYVQETSSYGPIARGTSSHLAAVQQQYTNGAFLPASANPHAGTMVTPQGGFAGLRVRDYARCINLTREFHLDSKYPYHLPFLSSW